MNRATNPTSRNLSEKIGKTFSFFDHVDSTCSISHCFYFSNASLIVDFSALSYITIDLTLFSSYTFLDNKFVKGTSSSLILLLVYLDGKILASANQALLHQTQQTLEKYFKLKFLGDLKYFLGLEIAKSSNGVHLCQRKYTLQLHEDTSYLVPSLYLFLLILTYHYLKTIMICQIHQCTKYLLDDSYT